MSNHDVGEIVRGLTELERERLTGWKGPGGAAYSAISGRLCRIGLLNRDWSFTPLGIAVRAHLIEQEGSND